MSFNRIAWTTTVAICFIAAAILLASGYQGYAGVVAAVGVSAAINLT
jgi:polyferredoxin